VTPDVDLKVSAEHSTTSWRVRSIELMASIDDVVEKMEQQLRKLQQKVQDATAAGPSGGIAESPSGKRKMNLKREISA